MIFTSILTENILPWDANLGSDLIVHALWQHDCVLSIIMNSVNLFLSMKASTNQFFFKFVVIFVVSLVNPYASYSTINIFKLT